MIIKSNNNKYNIILIFKNWDILSKHYINLYYSKSFEKNIYWFNLMFSLVILNNRKKNQIQIKFTPIQLFYIYIYIDRQK